MATEVGVGYVRLIPSMRGFQAAAERALGAPMRATSRRVGEESGQALTGRMAASMRSAGGTMTAAITTPLSGIGTSALLAAADFESAMNGVRAVTGVTGRDFAALEDQAKGLGATTQFSATEAASAMEFLGMAGWDTTQIMSGLPDVLNLAAASGVNLGAAADIASNIMSGFGIEAEDMGRVSDVLAATLTSTNVTMESLGESMKYAAPLAQSAGWSLEETAAAVGFLGNAGIQGSMAGSGLNSILATLADTSSTGGARLQEFGVAAQDSTGAVRPLTDILEDLATEGADVADVISIFGLEAGPKMQALLGQGSEGIRELIGDLESSEGAAQEMADIRMEGFSGSLMELKSAWQGLMIAIAEAGILEWATDLSQRLTSLVSRLTETDSSALRMATVLGMVAAAAGPLLVVLSFAVNQLTMAARTMVAFGRGAITVVTGFARMAAATSVFAVRMAVVTAQFTAMVVRSTAQMAVMAARVVAGWVMMAAQSMMHAARMAAAWVVAMGPVGWITAAIVALVALVIANWDSIVSRTASAWDWVWDKVKWVVDKLVGLFLNFTVVGLIIKHWTTIRERTAEIFTAVVDWLRGVPGMIYDAFLNFTPLGLIIKHWTTIRERTVSIVTGIVTWLRNFPGLVVSAIAGMAGMLATSATTAWNRFRSASAGRISSIITLVRGIPKRAIDALSGIGNRFVSIGRAIISGMVRGIRNSAHLIGDSLKNIATSALDSAKSFLGISSPSTLFRDEVGRWIPAGVQAGVDSGTDPLERSLEQMAHVPDSPVLHAATSHHRAGASAAPQLVLTADGSRASRVLMELISQAVRTQYGGDITRLGRA